MRVYRQSTASSIGAFTSVASFELDLNNSASVGPLGANAFVAYATMNASMGFAMTGTMRALNPVACNRSASNATTMYSIGGEAGNMSTGTVTTMAAMNFLIRNDLGGTVTTAQLIRLDRPVGRTSGTPNSTWTTIQGISFPDMTPSGASNTVTNATEVISITAQTGTGSMNIRALGSTAHSRHVGKFMFGADAAPSVDVHITGAIATARSTVSLTADNQTVTVTNVSYVALSSNNATATNRTFILSAGAVAGHRVTLEWVGTNAGELVDDSAAGSGNHRLSATWTPTQYDTIELIWNGTDWLELNRSAN
jgi:hypothetical protein